jgi:hypothetical protein
MIREPADDALETMPVEAPALRMVPRTVAA